jgi:NAD(P)-dependent dehydrogenase (short-subunit alcohol dehydrogenase family)
MQLTQGVAEVMTREKSGGSIVNIGSINAHGGQSNLPMYSSTKGALTTMTKHAAWALRKQRIRSNYIAVGWMFTPAEHKLKTTSEAQPGAAGGMFPCLMWFSHVLSSLLNPS